MVKSLNIRLKIKYRSSPYKIATAVNPTTCHTQSSYMLDNIFSDIHAKSNHCQSSKLLAL